MAKTSTFGALGRVFRESNCTCVLVGGFAVGYHRFVRQTLDVDLMIADGDFSRIKKPLEQIGYRSYDETDAFARFEDPSERLMDLDLLFVDAETMKKIVDSGKAVVIAEERFLIPSLEHLISMKLHAIKQAPKYREMKDLLDIAVLVRENGIDVGSTAFRERCLEFGSPEIYNRIRTALGEGGDGEA